MNKTLLISIMILAVSCTTRKELAYLGNLSEFGEDERFQVAMPEYTIQKRDILYITLKAMTPDGTVSDFLSGRSASSGSYSQNEAGQYMFGYDVNSDGSILLPVLGKIEVSGFNLDEARARIQAEADRHFNNSTVECKLLSYKFTVIGEVRAPGTYFNYNNYLTVLEAIGKAGGVTDFGRRDKVRVIRTTNTGTNTYTLNLQDKSILTSEAYFLLPNDVLIIEPESKKLFNLNLAVYSFILTSVTSVLTTTLLLINYMK